MTTRIEKHDPRPFIRSAGKNGREHVIDPRFDTEIKRMFHTRIGAWNALVAISKLRDEQEVIETIDRHKKRDANFFADPFEGHPEDSWLRIFGAKEGERNG
jgi:hypothetical protein